MQIYPYVLILFVLERLHPFRAEPLPWLRRETALDGIYFAQSNLIRHGVIFLGGLLMLRLGWVPHQRVRLPWPAALLTGCLVSDLSIYVVHRWLHRPGLPWRAHLTHHSIELLDSLAAFRFHALEQALYTCLYFCSVLIFVVGFGFPAVPFIGGYFVGSLWEVFVHSNLRVDPTWRVFALLYSPEAHRIHHADRTINKNYGNIFTLWDRAFGTYLSPSEAARGEIGSVREPELRGSYRFHFLHPFFPRASRRSGKK